MTLRGRVRRGVIVLEAPATLPEGTEVTVRPVNGKPRKPSSNRKAKTAREGLLKHAGKIKNLPPDAARNLDHYLYDHPSQ
jgi:hypothetical protein